MAVPYLNISPTTNYSVPDQSEQFALVQRINLALKLNHDEQTYTPPDNTFVIGEGKLKELSNGETWYFQPAFELVTASWDTDPDAASPSLTDYHFKIRYLRLTPDQTALDGTVDLHATEPTIASLSKNFYRNATHQNGIDLSANNLGGTFKNSSTDGLNTQGRPPLCFIADIMGDCFGVEIVGDWAVPLVSGNQCWTVNLVTGARVELLGFSNVAVQIASLELTTDPLDPPWGKNFTNYPFTAKMYNVFGKLDETTVMVQEITQTFHTSVGSAFGEQKITKNIAPHSWLNPPGATSPTFAWPSPSDTGIGSWLEWWWRDPYPGGETAIDSVADDAVYDIDLTTPGVQPGSVGFSTASGNVTVTKVYPGSAAPPIRTLEAAPLPDDIRNARTPSELDTLLVQLQADINAEAADPVWKGWKQVSETVKYLFLDVSDFSTKSVYEPSTGTATEPGDDGIVRGVSIFDYERGAEDIVAQRESTTSPGFYYPNDRNPPAGYKGGGESISLANQQFGQFAWYTADLSSSGRTQYALFSTSSGPNATVGSPPGIYIPYGTGAATPLAPGTLGWMGGILITIYAPIPDGIGTGAKPLPHHGTKYVTDGEQIIFLTRDSSFFQHVNDVYEVGSEDAAIEELHKIVCIRKAGAAWVVAWTLDTFEYMEEALNVGGVRLHSSGDCRSNGILTNSGRFLYCVLFGGKGERLVKIDTTSGGIVDFLQLSDPGFHLVGSGFGQVGGLSLYHDNLIISNRAPLGIGFNNEWWRLQIDET